jgi:hypothetical protein
MSQSWERYIADEEAANTGICLEHRATCDLPADPQMIDTIDCATECAGYPMCPFTSMQTTGEGPK